MSSPSRKIHKKDANAPIWGWSLNSTDTPFVIKVNYLNPETEEHNNAFFLLGNKTSGWSQLLGATDESIKQSSTSIYKTPMRTALATCESEVGKLIDRLTTVGLESGSEMIKLKSDEFTIPNAKVARTSE